MAWFWWLVAVFIVIIWVFTIVDIIRRRHSRSSGQNAAWILLVLIIPLIGTIVYFLVNGTEGSKAVRDADLDQLSGPRY